MQPSFSIYVDRSTPNPLITLLSGLAKSGGIGSHIIDKPKKSLFQIEQRCKGKQLLGGGGLCVLTGP